MVSEIICGDALEVLRSLPAEYVQTVVTSPPYYGLRDYGAETIMQLGDDPQDCTHEWIHEGRNEEGAKVAQCNHCDAVKYDYQIGREETPAMYVAKLVEVFRELRRVLRDDGTVWLNLGDSYASQGGMQIDGTKQTPGSQQGAWNGTPRKPPYGLKPKDLMMMPARVAIALCDDGWYLRSDIIWHKTNAMPESVKDRPTKAHEYVFLLSKSERYFYDQDAIREPQVDDEKTFYSKLIKQDHKQVREYGTESFARTKVGFKDATYNPAGRNKRSVWSLPTQSFPGSHFAVMAPKLAETCILAGSRPGDIILDPFSGAGTTAYVANRLNRRYLGIELNPAYVEMSRERLAQLALEVGA